MKTNTENMALEKCLSTVFLETPSLVLSTSFKWLPTSWTFRPHSITGSLEVELVAQGLMLTSLWPEEWELLLSTSEKILTSVVTLCESKEAFCEILVNLFSSRKKF